MRIPLLPPRTPVVSVVSLSGLIAADMRGAALNLAAVEPMLDRAFRRRGTCAVALRINSPGGSPVQSSMIGAAIRRLAEETEVPVHAFVEDVAASGGYWLAAAADDIWLDESSITGSIGVISAGFGFSEALGKLGVERRVHTAGEDKSMLDPFRPERAEDVERLKALQGRIHRAFIAHVEARRGAKLDRSRDLFTGEIFVGREAVEAGLADGIAHLVPKMRALYGERVRFRRLARRRPLATRLVPWVADAAAASALAALDERAARARLGL
ncbi:S49 family peptidase [Jannaschia sp. W003]|uniref:S49 family peptidase n=1 Tax=Jannaschia sp. W003 TaxID=2867012 RepID=UPI0021A2A2D2|nr:S49 family peptidase [Jannaschia sp. W003]UWQ22474.1 S49 family peptidase [Jannaschia sp. W003]